MIKQRTILRYICVTLFVMCMFFFGNLSNVFASEFRTDYFVDYYLEEKDNNIATNVSFHIKITNLTTNSFIRKFSIMFPKGFQIGNIRAKDDFISINPEITVENENQKIGVEFSNPLVGLNQENNIYLDFLQYNLFKVNGNVWEVILPTVENRESGGEYIVKVHLPINSGKKISISKPKPSHITQNEIIWSNPANKTIYAVFGNQQNFDLELRYHLKNPRVTRVYTDISFPPDTLYQKVFVNLVEPYPADVFMDDDGNYLGRYYLNPKEEKTIYFKGSISLFSEPRNDMKEPIKTLFSSQKKYLLSQTGHWKIDTVPVIPNTDIIQNVYDYTINTLTYNYGRLETDVNRLGASQALVFPDQAVCTEYSDVFVALARANGIYAREIQGYGFSSDQNIRPLSVNSDILHSWPEYYDTKTQLWVPLDPTWEDTSGIDYKSSFDLNHIVFAIHGEKSDYPYPAGSYKKEDVTKDVNIKATSDFFPENNNLSFEIQSFQIPSLQTNTYTFKVRVTNTGNVFVWEMPISALAQNLEIFPSTRIIRSLAPMQKIDLTYEYRVDGLIGKSETLLVLSSNSRKLHEQNITVSAVYYQIAKTSGLILIGIVCTIILIIFLRKMVSYKHE